MHEALRQLGFLLSLLGTNKYKKQKFVLADDSLEIIIVEKKKKNSRQSGLLVCQPAVAPKHHRNQSEQ